MLELCNFHSYFLFYFFRLDILIVFSCQHVSSLRFSQCWSAYAGRGRGKGVLPPGSTPWVLQTSLAKTDLHRLDQLASLEQRRLKDEEKGDKDGEEKKPGEGDDGDGENEEIEDEEDEIADDDYAQTFGFDDDEEYDVDDGGDDEGPVY